MPNQGSPGKPRDRAQIDFTKQGMADLDQMRDDLELRSRGAVIRLGLYALRWILQEKRRGRRIVSEGLQDGDRQQIVLLLADIEGKTEAEATRARADDGDGDGPDLSGDDSGDARADEPSVSDEASSSTGGSDRSGDLAPAAVPPRADRTSADPGSDPGSDPIENHRPPGESSGTDEGAR